VTSSIGHGSMRDWVSWPAAIADPGYRMPSYKPACILTDSSGLRGNARMLA